MAAEERMRDGGFHFEFHWRHRLWARTSRFATLVWFSVGPFTSSLTRNIDPRRILALGIKGETMRAMLLPILPREVVFGNCG